MSARGDSRDPARRPGERESRRPDEQERSPGSGEALVGLVLCGGLSRRMGRDKAGLELAGVTLLERAAALLEHGTQAVLLAVGSSPRRTSTRPQILDLRPQAGPLAGLEAGLQAAEERHGPAWVLTLACDMPWAERALFDDLLACAREADADAALLASEAGDEPLFAVYHTRLLPTIRAALDAGERKLVSFHSHALVPERGAPARAVRIVRLAAPSPDAARNVNTPEDFALVRARLASSVDAQVLVARGARA